MEDVLDLYAEPYDPQRPRVNFDETSKQLIEETREALPAKAGKPVRYDYEYSRNAMTMNIAATGCVISLCSVNHRRGGGTLT